MAIDSTFDVKKSVGVDIDSSLIQMSNERISKRYPRPKNIEFICADLLDIDGACGEIWKKIEEECTVLTMYFVDEALQKIKPILEEKLGGSGCNVVTVGYNMKGWEPVWVEVILGLPVHLYKMKNKEESAPTPEEMLTGNDSSMSASDLVDKFGEDEKDELNPFLDDGPPPEDPEYDESEDHWDFDENETYDDNVIESKDNHKK